MKIHEFLETLETKFGEGLYRKINYYYKPNKKGKQTKYPIDDFNNWDRDKIMSQRGKWRGDKINTFSFYIKYVPNLICIDFDTKDCINNELFKKLKQDNAWYTETKQGFHFYIFVDNLQSYSNEIRVGKGIDIDLINKKRNIWELPEREIIGEEKHYNWDRINFFLMKIK